MAGRFVTENRGGLAEASPHAEGERRLLQLRQGPFHGIGIAGAQLGDRFLQFCAHSKQSVTVCGHRQDAEDTAQETLLQTVPRLPRFDSPEALAVWLYKVVRIIGLREGTHSWD